MGKVILITGAARGFGRLVAELAAARGAKIVACDVDAEALSATIADLTRSGAEAIGQPTDVTDLAQLKALAALALERFGRIDVLVNNAGVMPLAFFSDHAAAGPGWDRAIDINFRGVLNGIAAVYDAMIAQGRGQIVNISSTYSNYATEGSGVYGATKTAVNVLSESLRMEAQGKIKVTTVRPTGVPKTGLGGSVVNPRGVIGMLGHHQADVMAMMGKYLKGELEEKFVDPESPQYWALDPEHIARNILYVIDQPWGVSISDITIRATGEGYLL